MHHRNRTAGPRIHDLREAQEQMPTETEEFVRSGLKRSGWLQMGIPEKDLTYTIGVMAKFKHPEIVVHGLPIDISSQLIKGVVSLIEGGGYFTPGVNYHNIAANYPAQFVAVDPRNHSRWLHWAVKMYDGEPGSLQAIQLVWCDANGKFPWEEGFRKKINELQWLLNVPRSLDAATSHFQQDCKCGFCGKQI